MLVLLFALVRLICNAAGHALGLGPCNGPPALFVARPASRGFQLSAVDGLCVGSNDSGFGTFACINASNGGWSSFLLGVIVASRGEPAFAAPNCTVKVGGCALVQVPTGDFGSRFCIVNSGVNLAIDEVTIWSQMLF